MSVETHTQHLLEAATTGKVDEVRRLLPISDPLFKCSGALRMAAQEGHWECVQLLIPVSDPRALEEETLEAGTVLETALELAAMHGHLACVRLLIPVSNPRTHQSGALVGAAINGHVACVKELIPVSDPKSSNSLALQCAAFHGHHNCVDVLFAFSDPDAALEKLQPISFEIRWAYLADKIQRHRVWEQRQTLVEEVSFHHAHTISPKTRKI